MKSLGQYSLFQQAFHDAMYRQKYEHCEVISVKSYQAFSISAKQIPAEMVSCDRKPDVLIIRDF